ncbi:hypothetical protein TNCV_1352841 [Trichonephila clavipes]|nr:hypothetical protein TNCV_1352841 [Trichonephila clavipes]
MAKTFWCLFKAQKNIIDVDSGDKNEMNNAAPVSKSSEMRNVMKSRHCRKEIVSKVMLHDFNDVTYPIKYISSQWVLNSENKKKSLGLDRENRVDVINFQTHSLIPTITSRNKRAKSWTLRRSTPWRQTSFGAPRILPPYDEG